MGATLYQVSTLLMLVGLPQRPRWAGNGGRGRGWPGRSSSEAHERSFLAADERAGADPDLDVEIEATAQDVPAQQAAFAGGGDGAFQADDGDGVVART